MLENGWPDLTSGNNNLFWEHEWNNHGKASGLDQQDFFIKGMQLFAFVDLDRKFATANIPTRDRPYDKQYIKTRLAQLMDGVEPMFVCKGTKNNRQLAEVRSCVNMTNHFIPCGPNGQLPDIDCDYSSVVLFQL